MKDNSKVTNRAARRDYFILENIEAGLELKGAEVKSLRAGKASLAESFAKIEGSEIFLYHMHINPYEPSDIAWGIKQMLSSKEKPVLMGQNARQRVIDQFSWDAVVTRTLEIYQEIVN